MGNISAGLLPQCYMTNKKCTHRNKIKIKQGKYKGEVVYICEDGRSEEKHDCIFEAGQFISESIGKPTDAKVIRGRENVPRGDNFAWWSCHYEYKNKNTGEVFKLEDLQEKYHMGFGQQELWDIIEKDYITEEVYVMNVNHPKYDKNDKSDDIVFED